MKLKEGEFHWHMWSKRPRIEHLPSPRKKKIKKMRKKTPLLTILARSPFSSVASSLRSLSTCNNKKKVQYKKIIINKTYKCSPWSYRHEARSTEALLISRRDSSQKDLNQTTNKTEIMVSLHQQTPKKGFHFDGHKKKKLKKNAKTKKTTSSSKATSADQDLEVINPTRQHLTR